MKKSFSISPRILAHLGEDLIKNESIALLEMVKNSYDACAKECIVEFIMNNIGELEKIVVEDDGFGMNMKVIEEVWLKIGTDFKFKKIEPNICGRIPLGEKGIGRLSVHKLGSKITLTTKKNNFKEVQVNIDWNQLEEAKDFDDFKIEIIENDKPIFFKNKTGTKIVIEELKSTWDKRQLREVYRNLTSLNSPFSETNESFSVLPISNTEIFADLPNFEDIKNNALYFCHCKIEEDRIKEFKYEFIPWTTLIKVSKGRTIYKKDLMKEDLIVKDDTIENNPINLNAYQIGPIEFDLIIFEKDSQIFNYVNAEKSSINEYLRENGGIRVYRDGVRVYDYGERDNDWLGIDLKRVGRVGGNVSNNIIIGAVKIKRSDSFGLKEKTNREGFIENESYGKFVDAINYILSIFVRERNVDKTILTTLYKKHKVVEPVLSDLKEVIELVEEKVEKKETKEEILKYLNRIDDQYSEVKEILLKSANAGLNLSVVIHELEKLISSLKGFIERNEKKKAIDISLMLEKIIKGYSAMIKKSEIKKNTVSKVVFRTLENYEFRFKDHRISVLSNWSNNNMEAYYAEAESISVLTNLLDNSIFWLNYARIEKKVISVYITDEIKDYISVIISDNGPGFNIPVDIAIKPFITGKPHNIGSGLGLHVANEMMNAMKGKLIFLNKNDILLPQNTVYCKADMAIIALCFPKEKKVKNK